jgi:hypothetical protein
MLKPRLPSCALLHRSCSACRSPRALDRLIDALGDTQHEFGALEPAEADLL